MVTLGEAILIASLICNLQVLLFFTNKKFRKFIKSCLEEE